MGEVSIEEMLEETRGVAVVVFELGPGDGDGDAEANQVRLL